jgi:hypothetical protein
MTAPTVLRALDLQMAFRVLKEYLVDPIHKYRALAMVRRLDDICAPAIELQKEIGRILPPDYNDKRMAILNKYGRKDANGTLLQADGQYLIQDDKRAQFEAESAVLQNNPAYKEAVIRFDAEEKKLKSLMLSETTLPELWRPKLSWIKKTEHDADLGKAMDVLFDYIDDDSGAAETKKA